MYSTTTTTATSSSSGLQIHNSNSNYQQLQGMLEGTNLPGDACLMLSTDPKPRLRWTSELHDRFVDAVAQLGGPDSMSFFLSINVHFS